MVRASRILVIFAGFGATIGFAAEPKEPPKPKIEIHWVELFPVKGLTVDRSAHNGSDTRNDYYPHTKPAMILSREDVAVARLDKFDWMMNGEVVQHYSVTLALTKEARVRLAKSCPGKTARITVAVDGHYWGWDHYTTDNEAAISERWKSKNYSPSMGLMSRANAERIINAFK
ncbi:MAG: hypothetical protein U0840_30670 [Gemmataceae bacterium]